MAFRYRHPRRQAERLAELVAREGSRFQGAVLGRRREGKSDLLLQVRDELFSRAEGPVPFLYAFDAAWQNSSDPAIAARHCFASFCQQLRAFLMRQEDLLGEPVALLERELERPGLPLSLTELAQNFLPLPPDQQLAFVATLPGQLAYLEQRPVCWLLDEVHRLPADSPILSSLESKDFSWLVSGRYGFLSRFAGESAWPVVPLEPFPLEEIINMAERLSREAELPFVHEVWRAWLQAVGASPWLIHSILASIVAHGDSIASVEDLGRVYIRELATGTAGNWLAARFDSALPDIRDRLTVGRYLQGLTGIGKSDLTPVLPPQVWKGLVEEEWADDTPVGPRWRLQTVEWDWLWMTTSLYAGSSQRAQARALQALLVRTEPDWRVRGTAPLWASIRSRILALPQVGFPLIPEQDEPPFHAPEICSVALETGGGAELYWCYGFQEGRKDIPEAACVLLIALCTEEPTSAHIEEWKRELQREESRLPGASHRQREFGEKGGFRSDLWLVLPSMVLQEPAIGVRRFSFEQLAQWLKIETP